MPIATHPRRTVLASAAALAWAEALGDGTRGRVVLAEELDHDRPPPAVRARVVERRGSAAMDDVGDRNVLADDEGARAAAFPFVRSSLRVVDDVGDLDGRTEHGAILPRPPVRRVRLPR